MDRKLIFQMLPARKDELERNIISLYFVLFASQDKIEIEQILIETFVGCPCNQCLTDMKALLRHKEITENDCIH